MPMTGPACLSVVDVQPYIVVPQPLVARSVLVKIYLPVVVGLTGRMLEAERPMVLIWSLGSSIWQLERWYSRIGRSVSL